MPRYLRPRSSSDPVFFMVCLADRTSDALMAHLDILREAVGVTRRDQPFGILAWVVLPDHMHAVWQLPAEDPDYAQRWRRIKARFSRDARRTGLVPPVPRAGFRPRKGELGIWQQGFWEHHCRNEADVASHIRYCWSNPVKHGLVRKPTDWVASSIHRDVRLGNVDSQWSGVIAEGDFGEAA